MTEMATWNLPVIWAGIIAFVVIMYVLLDGFDLGVGILFAFERKRSDRDIMVNSIAPYWDGNETWLVMGGGGLLAAFPLAYSIILPAMYPAIILMLISLIFRGAAFEFRFRATTERGAWIWDMAFFSGSTLAAFAQGLILGGLFQGVKVVNNAYAGGWWDWLTPFTLVCGIAVTLGYCLLGACWMIWRTEGGLQERARHLAKLFGIATLIMIGIVSLWSPFLNPTFLHRWFEWPGIALTSPVPILLFLLSLGFWHGLRNQHDQTPLLCAMGCFLLCFAGLGISFWPMMIPPSISIADASAPPESQLFLLVGAIVIIPIILIYTGFAYWTFRGKISHDAGYH